ncbi:bifunctional DNA-formamidopyrimidine glycosylase/DNA-(apurinic or apyrimidinic site) lyase [Bacillus sp. SD088]|uniref:bifunctional DNA-formamidopyrimidine glycosylase/DNA-(apurinic or apyrimidinic site) lyase n=1 Tax=Bacillus sp. SD088 TaxID=2782012 RepID=UPI001A95FC14|nr:bifunctional DNA-formamidopyrimidine glycosylase/DNA-(apurinic or apyrimidinic site) lyase [Bacillus sp. SD088]MBO0992915.1 bifunctional DNA-formamidopyrimidine glycosylase/DNA-(apurinic or apyrimidinic site) lyase [Bacillus sp. SD088]
MPELPEMENYKHLLQDKIQEEKITAVAIQREKSINLPTELFIEKVSNQQIKGVSRRAKYLIFHLQNGDHLLLHLMLGGWLFYGKTDEKPNRTVQVQLSFGDQHLYFIGLRLGYLHSLSTEQLEEELEPLGPEPLNPNFSLDTFLVLLQAKKGALKTALIDQKFIAGIGNRYSDEILWHAGLLPERKATELDQAQMVRLFQSIQTILRQGIQLGGYMDEPFYQGDPKTGGAKEKMYVHNREGKACPRCGKSIVKTEISSRNTFYCPNCQK